MISRGANFVEICYCLNKKNICLVVPREEAYRIRKQLDKLNGTIYKFEPRGNLC